MKNYRKAKKGETTCDRCHFSVSYPWRRGGILQDRQRGLQAKGIRSKHLRSRAMGRPHRPPAKGVMQ
jgi:hypothetical protein